MKTDTSEEGLEALIVADMTGRPSERVASTRESADGRTSPKATGRPLTTVEMACLKINCSCALFSKRTEYLSKERILPVSLTPLTR